MTISRVTVAAASLAVVCSLQIAVAQEPVTCQTIRPGPDWTCANGNWYPPGMTIPGAPAPVPSPLPPSPPVSPPATCPTVRPGPDWMCAHGNWYPPGMTIPGGLPPAIIPDPPVIPPIPQPPDTSGCPGTDPFAEMWGLIGTCVDGNWIPVEVIKGPATVRWSTFLSLSGFWEVVFDKGIVDAERSRSFVPLGELPAEFRIDGLPVIVIGKRRFDWVSLHGPVLEIISIH